MCDHDWSCDCISDINWYYLHSHLLYPNTQNIPENHVGISCRDLWKCQWKMCKTLSHSWMMLDFFSPHGKFIGNSTHPSGLYIPHLALQPLVVHVHHLNIQDAWRNHNLGEIIGEIWRNDRIADFKLWSGLKNWITQSKLEAWHSSSRLLKVVKLLWKVSNGIIPPDIAQVTCFSTRQSQRHSPGRGSSRKNKTRPPGRPPIHVFSQISNGLIMITPQPGSLSEIYAPCWTGPVVSQVDVGCIVLFPSPLHLIVGILSCHLHLTCNLNKLHMDMLICWIKIFDDIRTSGWMICIWLSVPLFGAVPLAPADVGEKFVEHNFPNSPETQREWVILAFDDSRNRCTVRITLNKKKHLVIILLLLPYFLIKSLIIIIIGLLINNNHQSMVNNHQ